MPAVRSNKSYDVAVIGAGVFGAWIAWHLQRSGKRAIIVDAYGAGNSRSSSGGESRIIRMGYGVDEIYTRSAQRSLALWLELAAEVNEPLFHRTGVLWLAHEHDPYPQQCLVTLDRIGITYERLSTGELATRYPQLAAGDLSWALLEPQSGALMARRSVQAVVREALKLGADWLQEKIVAPSGSGVLDYVSSGAGKQIRAEKYVFACGPWLPQLFPELLGGRIRPTRQEVFFFGAGAQASMYSPASLPVWIDFKDEAYGFPDLENRGVKVAIDRHGPPFDPECGDRFVTEEGLGEARQYLARRTPSLRDAPLVESRVCQYENTSQGDFLIDLHPDLENVWLVGGGSGHGFKHGPSVGEYLGRRLDGIEEGTEPRFSLATKGLTAERAVY